jgi:NAD(P)-dependent dehydrogenase (short-subunit alcohol dehydrogenase family)
MGRASTRLFAKEGATVFIAGRNRERGQALAKEITDGGGRAFFVELEVTDQAQWDSAVAQVREQAGWAAHPDEHRRVERAGDAP